MSVVWLSDPAYFEPDGLINFFGLNSPERCFLCGRPLVDPAVFWHGSGRNALWLHWKCAQELALALLYDGRRAEAVAVGQKLDAGVHERPVVAAYRCRST